ncbi:MAG: enoyl-CoA hydratase/isomerase family protein [Deltaproteobacteria bacterium]|nr:enoyl-CoA hydratase/isomerase family protein [Deltaproteobacteria bacterium]
MSYMKTEIVGGVGILSFNRPEVHNAMDDEAIAEIYDAFVWAKQNKDVRVVVLRGEGKSFHAGRDVRVMGVRKPGVSHYEFMKTGQRNIVTLLEMGKPTIAAMKGGTVGGGAEFALCCDIRVSSTELKFALPEVKFGLAVDQGGSALAVSLIGPSKTKWLLMTGETIGAQTALEWGVVDFLVAPEELDAKVMEIATKIAANPTRAVLAAKDLVDELWADGVRAAIRRELTTQLALFASEEFAELRAKRQAAMQAKR